jgi:aspartate kinase
MVGTVGFDAGLMEVFCKHGVSYILKATNANSIAHLVWDSQATAGAGGRAGRDNTRS